MYFRRIFLQLCLLLSPCSLSAMMGMQASDVDYYIHSQPSFSLIFSENFLEEKAGPYLHIHKKITYYNDIYREVFSKTLKEVPIYIFASPRNQISNAITSGIPFLRVLFFPTGTEHMTRIGSTSWEDTVIAHEMAHIFQIGQISSILKYIRPVFRNSEIIFLPIPIFLNTNIVMSFFFLEGHAVLSESLFAPGGRLYSGWARALVFSQLKYKYQNTDQFIRDYLINLTEDTFTIEQQYTHGAYFFNTLLKKYSIKTVNSFFTAHAEHFILPASFISIKASFEKTFNTSFASLANYYVQEYLPLAAKQINSPEKTLFKSRICPPFNKKDEKIFFLSSNLEKTPLLRILDTRTGKWTKRKFTTSIGKVFNINNEYHVTASHEVSPTKRIYGLFSEGMWPSEKYQSQSMQDIYEDQVLSLDTDNNLKSFNLNLNGKFYDEVNSPALFGPDGSVYYFKQIEKQRVMYKNRTPLFGFKGFYGSPAEIGPDGTVYFIAASLYGSSLFSWNEMQGFSRVSPSDVIIDARQVSDGKFLICELGPNYYSYKLVDAYASKERPVFYNYPAFERTASSLATLTSLSQMKSEETTMLTTEQEDIITDQYIDNLDQMDESELQVQEELQAPSSKEIHKIPHYRPYSALRHIQFNGIDLGYFNDPITGYNGLISASFQDPLEYNSFHIGYQRSLENWTLQNKYINQVYRLSWDLQYIYKEGLENFAGSRAYSYIHEISQGFLYPLYRKGYWSASFYIKSAWSYVEIRRFSEPSYYLSTEPSWLIQYKRAYAKGFDYHRHFLLEHSLQYHYNVVNGDSNLRFKLRSFYKIHLGGEFYTTPSINYQTAVKEKSIPLRYFTPLNLSSGPDFTVIARERVFQETNNLVALGLRVQKFIETPIYFTRYPLSIKGIAPLLKAEYMQFLDNDLKEAVNLIEWTLGLKFSVLLHHRVKFKLGIYYGYSQGIKWDFWKNITGENPWVGLSHIGVNLKLGNDPLVKPIPHLAH